MPTNPMQFIFDLFDQFNGFIEACKEFLFTEINVLGFTFSVWQFLGGASVVAILIAIIVKAVI